MDLPRYLARIGLPAVPRADAEGLAAVQAAHRLAIGFENLDAMLGRAIRIDSEAVFDKLVLRGRGGYCFEQNRLFGDALAAIGIASRPLLARVRLGAMPATTPPRTHVCLLAEPGGEPWLADAGFGGSNLPPMPLAHGAEARTDDGARHRLRRIGAPGTLDGEWLLERAGPAESTDGRGGANGEWQPQYSFDLAEVAPDDLEQANHWTATRPGTRFTTLHIASIPLARGFASLTDRALSVTGPDGTTRRTIATAHDYACTLRETFRIELAVDEVARLPLFAD